jgi:hypothetical protein
MSITIQPFNETRPIRVKQLRIPHSALRIKFIRVHLWSKICSLYFAFSAFFVVEKNPR